MSAQALYKRPPCQNLRTRSPWLSKFAPHHNESDLRGPKWREGCVRGLCDTQFVWACTVEMHMDISRGHVCAVRVIKNAAHVWEHLEWTPGLNSYRKNHKCGHSVWGTTPLKTHLNTNMNLDKTWSIIVFLVENWFFLNSFFIIHIWPRYVRSFLINFRHEITSLASIPGGQSWAASTRMGMCANSFIPR